tara:strand:- start:131 stop:1183 length:1053 start_codon:yes stop_codon:yes gene_type:complete
MSGTVTFVDPLAPGPYSGAPGQLVGLGGTETTLVRIAECLAGRHVVTVRQAARAKGAETVRGVRYAGLDLKRPLPEEPAVIVVINSWKVAPKLARMHPGARVIVWLHVFPGRHNRAHAAGMKQAGVEVICVSASHARWLRGFLGADAPPVSHVYNPIADDLVPDDTPRNPNLLLFAASPHKGLGQVFRRFGALRERLPDLRLAVADPGYLAWPAGPVPQGVLPLGRLPRADLMRWMRRSLCLFHAQDQFAETFGLVIAEANAVGCPALLHRGLGANDEIASDPSQCIDTTDPDAIAARLAAWRRGQLTLPRARPRFRLSAVARRWEEVLFGSPAPLAGLSHTAAHAGTAR